MTKNKGVFTSDMALLKLIYLATELAALLLFTGVGSYISGQYTLPARRILRNTLVGIPLVILLLSVGLPFVLRQAISLPMAGRVLLSLLLILPVGILLEHPFLQVCN